MTQPARRFDLWRRLYTRFLIEPYPVEPGEGPGILTEIVPVTSADELLKAYGNRAGVSASYNANGQVELIRVPDGERWTVYLIDIRRASGNRTFDRLLIADSSTGNATVFDDFTTTAEQWTQLRQPIVLEETDHLDINADAGSTATVHNISVWVAVEAAF